jgi:hypothetical protein
MKIAHNLGKLMMLCALMSLPTILASCSNNDSPEDPVSPTWQPSNYRDSKQPCYGIQPGTAARTGLNVTTVETFGTKNSMWNADYRGESLELTSFTETWRDDFNEMNISGPTGPDAKWYAPIHGAAGGEAKCLPPEPGPLGPSFPTGPFSVNNGLLTITAQKGYDGNWYTGVMETVDREGYGFAQQYGYWECRMQVPAGHGTWPAFWLKCAAERTDFSMNRPEIDIIEHYGSDAKGHHCSVHLHRANNADFWGNLLTGSVYKSYYFNLNNWGITISDNNQKLEVFHTYGLAMTKDWIIFYFDRKEIVRQPMYPEYHRPWFILIDNAIIPRATAEAYGNPMAEGVKELVIDYVVVYQYTDMLEEKK